eukprot:724113-Amphidinium_carterae.2
MSVEHEERCIAHEELEPIGDLFWCEDPVTNLMSSKSKFGWSMRIGGEIRKMSDLGVGQVIHRSEVTAGNRVWTGRWCHRKKNGGGNTRGRSTLIRSQVPQVCQQSESGWELQQCTAMRRADCTPCSGGIRGSSCKRS